MTLNIQVPEGDTNDKFTLNLWLSDEQQKNITVDQFLQLMEQMFNTINKEWDAAFSAQHPNFRYYHSTRQTEILMKFKKECTLYDLNNPAPAKPQLTIVK